MNLLCTELAGKRDYSEQHNSLTSNLFVDLCICVGEYFSGTKREFKFVLSDHENIAMSTEWPCLSYRFSP